MTWAALDGATAGSGRPRAACTRPAAVNAAHSPKETTSRSRGRRPRTTARVAPMSSPRNVSDRNTPSAPLSPSTWASSSPRNAGLTVTSTSPASAAPNSRTTHSGRFGDHTATRSPGENRDSSARATSSASSSSSPNVHWRRPGRPRSPSISAVRCGARAAASRSTEPIVVSRSGADRSAGQRASVSAAGRGGREAVGGVSGTRPTVPGPVPGVK